jgi:hypothetical protein
MIRSETKPGARGAPGGWLRENSAGAALQEAGLLGESTIQWMVALLASNPLDRGVSGGNIS